MAVTEVKELWSGRGGSNDGGKRSYTRVFQVQTNDPDDDAYVVGSALGVVIGDPHPSDAAALVDRIEPSNQDEMGTLWTVTVSYQSDMSESKDGSNQGKPEDRADDPTARPDVWKVASNQTEKIYIKDNLGEAITNSAGQAYDPPLKFPDGRAMITVTTNRAAFSFNTIHSLLNVVNSDEWEVPQLDYTFPIGSCQVRSIEAEQLFENAQEFWRVNWQIEYSPDLWQPVEVLDAGYYENVPPPSPGGESGSGEGDSRLRAILDENGHPVSSPWPLDGNGRALTAQQVLDGDHVFQSYSPFASTAFTGAVPT